MLECCQSGALPNQVSQHLHQSGETKAARDFFFYPQSYSEAGSELTAAYI